MLVRARCLRKASLLSCEPKLVNTIYDLLRCQFLPLERRAYIKLYHEFKERSLLRFLLILHVLHFYLLLAKGFDLVNDGRARLSRLRYLLWRIKINKPFQTKGVQLDQVRHRRR